MSGPVYTQDDIQALVVFAGEVLLAVAVGVCVMAFRLRNRTDNGPRRVVADTNARAQQEAAQQAFRDDATQAFEQVLHGSPTLAQVRAERAAREAESLDEEWAKLDQAVNGGETS